MSNEFISAEPTENGKYAFLMPVELRETIWDLIEQYSEFLNPDISESRRLFPTAYPDDPEREAGYQILSQNLLIESKKSNIALIKDSLDKKNLTEDETEAWLNTLNDIRLILGTKLDISEEDQREANLNSQEMDLLDLYEDLTILTEMFVESLNFNLSE